MKRAHNGHALVVRKDTLYVLSGQNGLDEYSKTQLEYLDLTVPGI